jgi:hypothetical protein
VILPVLSLKSEMADTFPFHTLYIVRELESIQSKYAPIVLPKTTYNFLSSIPDATSKQGLSLTAFLRDLPQGAIRDKAISQLLNRGVIDLMNRVELIALEKDAEIARRDFATAKELRAQQDFVLSEIDRLVPTPIRITPVAVVRVLQALGFDGELFPRR